MKKKFLISIDTEGDALWTWRPENPTEITSENAKYLPRFQSLCDEYGFKPTYLTNYEMANDDFFVSFASKAAQDGRAEIGMHLHAWNSPPLYDLPLRTDTDKPGAPYLIEYPDDITEEKIAVMTSLLTERFGTAPVSHRAGRWAMNEKYFELLSKYGYVCDCSVTPGKDWSAHPGMSPESKGSDYLNYPKTPYFTKSGILEIPVTVREDRRVRHSNGEGIKKTVRNTLRAVKGQGKIWLRPDGHNLDDLLYLLKITADSHSDDYIMFMLHSSELMPGVNPRFKTQEDVDRLYDDLKTLFPAAQTDFTGMTTGGYAELIKKK